MKRIVLFCLMFVFLPGTALSAEHIVQEGNTLSWLSIMTGHTIEQLMEMNDIENRNLIYIGQKIYYISDDDIEKAIIWCDILYAETSQEVMYIVSPIASSLFHDTRTNNLNFFSQTKAYLKKKQIRYYNDEPGVFFGIVINFAESMRRRWKGKQ